MQKFEGIIENGERLKYNNFIKFELNSTLIGRLSFGKYLLILRRERSQLQILKENI